jgi:pimeloyl-ACP methyl ester carboxylesterase
MAIEERRDQIGDVDVVWREAPATGPAPVLYLHGVPNDGDDWLPFLERSGGYAPDLPGFGRSDKPPHIDYSIEGYGRWLTAYVDALGLDRFSLVMHDWGSLGLELAQAMPDRVERIVLINAVPFLPGYTWHRAARLWRTPLVGELAMGFTFKWTLRRGGVPEQMLDHVYENFDHGTQRAILKLYRSAPPARLATAGARLGELTAPALVVWGEPDEYLPTEFADSYAEKLGGDARVEVIEGSGHWPWFDRPDVVDTITAFVSRD